MRADKRCLLPATWLLFTSKPQWENHLFIRIPGGLTRRECSAIGFGAYYHTAFRSERNIPTKPSRAKPRDEGGSLTRLVWLDKSLNLILTACADSKSCWRHNWTEEEVKGSPSVMFSCSSVTSLNDTKFKWLSKTCILKWLRKTFANSHPSTPICTKLLKTLHIYLFFKIITKVSNTCS